MDLDQRYCFASVLSSLAFLICSVCWRSSEELKTFSSGWLIVCICNKNRIKWYLNSMSLKKITENSSIYLRCQRRFMRSFLFQSALFTAKPLVASHAHVLKAWSRFPFWVRKWKPGMKTYRSFSHDVTAVIFVYKKMNRRPSLCTKKILWKLNSSHMLKLSFIPSNLQSRWPREWKRSIFKKERLRGRFISCSWHEKPLVLRIIIMSSAS